MFSILFLTSPFESFKIYKLFEFGLIMPVSNNNFSRFFDYFHFVISSSTLIIIYICVFFLYLYFIVFLFIDHFIKDYFVIGTTGIMQQLSDQLTGNNIDRFYPIIFFVFLFVVWSALTFNGFPYSPSLLVLLPIILTLATILFIGMVFFGFLDIGSHLFKLFLPHNAPVLLALLLIPIEVFSYIFRLVALAMRICINLTAGHILIHVGSSFLIWIIAVAFNHLSVLFTLPALLIILTFLYILELLIALLQAYVFTLLSCLYLSEIIILFRETKYSAEVVQTT